MAISLRKIGIRFGKYLGHLPILVITILIYVILSVATHFLLNCQGIKFSENQNAFLISYIVATGGDPSPYLQTLELYPFTYYWILIFHVLSWLFVPVVIALAADALYRMFEKRKNLAKILLRKKMRNILIQETSMSEDEAFEITEKFSETLEEKEFS